MKIISKFKDYYDYLSSVYGEDEKLVLDRREYSSIPYIPSDRTITTLHIGEYKVQGVWFNGTLHFGDQIEQFSNQNRSPYYLSEFSFSKSDYWTIPSGKFSNVYCLKTIKYLGDTSPTWKQDCPLLVGEKNFLKFPILKEYNLSSFVPPHDIWIYLTEWLSKRVTKNEISKEVENDIKVVNAGFDLKKSFRGK